MGETSVLKIAVVGPESTGKSSMAEALAKHYNTLWVPEFAREYCGKLNRAYTLEDEINMMNGQLAWENEALSKLQASPRNNNSSTLLFMDTTILSVKIWCDHVFKICPTEVLQEVQKRNYDLYLLMNIDMPWEEDPLREFPHLREHFFTVFENDLKNLVANYVVINGIGSTRLNNAIAAVEKFLGGRVSL